jgi:hypothetical protein
MHPHSPKQSTADSDRLFECVLTDAVVFQCFEGVPRRAKIVKSPGRVKLEQLANRNLLDGLELPGSDPEKDLFGFGIAKRTNHVFTLYIGKW